MAQDNRNTEDVRREIAAERAELARAVETLRAGLNEVTDVGAKLRSNLPVVGVAALGAGFVLAGGIGATARLVFRRGREGSQRARFGRFVVTERD
jgi:hypothetical protein